MTRPLPRLPIALLALAGVAAGAALAQDGDQGSRVERMIEGMISTPERQVDLIGLDGAFSSNPTVERIAVADRDGVWLTIDGVEMVWSRMALVRGRLDIESLEAKQVTVLRRPAPSAAESAGGGFALPVDLALDDFDLPDVRLAAAVAGSEARLSLAGSAQVDDAVAAARISAERLDRPGALTADLRLQPEDNVLTADLKFSEPAGGLVADLLTLRGRPALAITLAGAGPLDAWRADLAMDADGSRVLNGVAAITRAENAYRVTADLAAALERVAPESIAALVGGQSRLTFDILRDDAGGLTVQSAALRSDNVELSGSGGLTPDFVPLSAELALSLGQGGRAALPFVPGAPSVGRLQVRAGLDAGATAPWRAEIKAEGVTTDFGRVDSLAAIATGQARDLADAGGRATSFDIDATVEGLAPTDAALADAVGPSLELSGAGTWSAGAPVRLDNLRLILTGASLGFTGTATAEAMEGRFSAGVADLARVAALAGRPLAGGAQIQADGRLVLDGAAFDLALDGEATDLRLGIEPLDPLLAGAARITGGVARSADGVKFDGLNVAAAKATADVDGSFGPSELDLAVEASVADLAALSPRAQGRATISARIAGTAEAPEVTAEARGADVIMMGRPLTDATARFSGVVAGPRTSGEAQIAGALGGVPIAGSARLAAGDDGARRLDDLLLTVGESRAAGALTLRADGLVEGQLSVVSPDLSQVAPLALVEAAGSLNAEITLAAEQARQNARVSATARNVVVEDIRVGALDLSGDGRDLLAAPQLDGKFTLRDLRAGGLAVVSAEGAAERRGQSTSISAQARLAEGAATVQASLEPRPGGLAVALQNFTFARPGLETSLAAPATVLVRDGTARFEALTLRAGGGSVTLAGRAGAALDLRVQLADLPAALADAFAPRLGAQGRISGTAAVTGTAAAPRGRFDATWREASVGAARAAGLGPLDATAQGDLAAGRLTLSSRIAGPEGLALRVAGTVGIAAGSPLDLRVTGAAPLSLGNRQLAARGAALDGALEVDVAIAGTAAAPRFSGRLASEGGGFVDPVTGIVAKNLSLAASFDRNRLVIERLTAASGEGTISARGSLGLDAGLPVDLTAAVRNVRYVDGALVATRFDADLTLSGSLATGPVVGGSVFLARTEVTVPEQLPRDSVAVDVEHVNTPAAVEKTLALARNDTGRRPAGGGAAGGGATLDVTIRAPKRIFVRGRGLDAELGGEVRLTGPVSAIVADGAFTMSRGRLDILSQRLIFDRGVVTFAGDLDPILDFSGSTKSGDVSVTVAVAGQASDPEVTFSSVPELPQDEVLARLIFERGVGELSPVQIARLADAAAQLSGATGSGGILGKLRASTGLDDLDIVSDDSGAPAVAAGRYVSENVYIGVQQGASTESSRVTIDLDVTDDIKARAAVTPEGKSSLGIFFEREY